jgi:hypothetical protein
MLESAKVFKIHCRDCKKSFIRVFPSDLPKLPFVELKGSCYTLELLAHAESTIASCESLNMHDRLPIRLYDESRRSGVITISDYNGRCI